MTQPQNPRLIDFAARLCRSLFRKNAGLFETRGLSILNEIYSTGIVDLNGAAEDVENYDNIIVLKDKLAENYAINKLLTQKMAYESLTKSVNEYLDSNKRIISAIVTKIHT